MIDTRKLLCAIYMSNRKRYMTYYDVPTINSIVHSVLQHYENDNFEHIDEELAHYTIEYFKGYLIRIIMSNGQHTLNRLANVITSKTVTNDVDLHYLVQQLSSVKYNYCQDIAEMLYGNKQKFTCDILPYTCDFTFLFFLRKKRLLCASGLVEDKQVELICKAETYTKDYNRYVIGVKFPIIIDTNSSGLIYQHTDSRLTNA